MVTTFHVFYLSVVLSGKIHENPIAIRNMKWVVFFFSVWWAPSHPYFW